MQPPPKLKNEKVRLEALQRYRILDTMEEQVFDDITQLAASICGTSIALVSLIDNDRQWFKSRYGLKAPETPRDISFCGHAIGGREIFEVPDAFKDTRFLDNPLVTGQPVVRFYAGAPLVTPGGHAIGTLCVIDHAPKVLSPEQRAALSALARHVIGLLELRISNAGISEANEAALSAVHSKSQFLANISHEIRTPMNGVIGMCNLLLADNPTPSQKERLKIIQNCGTSLLELINDVLDFSKLEIANVELEREPFDLHSNVREIVELLRPRALEKGVLLTYTPDPKVPSWVSGDSMRFRQIVINLISNAIKFTERGRVQVSCRIAEEKDGTYQIQFSVQDTGVGIPKSLHEKLFVPFSQADVSTTRKFGGTGLGLTISKALCEKMGGSIWFESKEGEGSIFYFTVQLASVKPHQATHLLARDEMFSDKMAHHMPLQILVAEDNRVNQMVAVGYLEKLGYKCDLVSDGAQALKALKGKTYDLILLDCHMPELDGYETAKQICKIYEPSVRPKLVGISASTFKEDVDLCLASGMDDFIPKPLLIKDLIRILNACKTGAVIDSSKILQNFKGLEEIISGTLEQFFTEGTERLEAISESIHKGDAQRLFVEAHTLKGMTSNFYATKAIELAKDLEQMGRTKNLKSASATLKKLEAEMARVYTALKALPQYKKNVA